MNFWRIISRCASEPFNVALASARLEELLR